MVVRKKEIEYEVGTYAGKYENDFIIKKSISVECKVFKAEKDSIAIRSEIDSSLSQIQKHIEKLNSEDVKIKQAYLLWNRSEDGEEFQMKLQDEYTELFKKYKFMIICPDEIEDFVAKIKQ